MASVTAQSRNHVVLNASRYVCLWGRVRARRVRSRPVSHLLVYLNEMTRCSGALLHAVLFESCTDVGMTVFRRPAGQSDRQQQQQRRRRQQKIPTQLWKTTAVEMLEYRHGHGRRGRRCGIRNRHTNSLITSSGELYRVLWMQSRARTFLCL